VAELQRQSIKKAKSIRDQDKVMRTLNDLRQACRDNKNTMPFIIDCVREYTTMGEISDAMKDVYGEYIEPPNL
jgi:methylmalonyl-CoA mutase N-terminal domain/subunit